MGREPFAAERSAALVRTSILWTDDRLESQEEIMENLVTRRSRRSLLGLLGVLAVSPKRSRAEAWWRTLDATAFPQANGDDRHWAKQPVVPNKIKDRIEPRSTRVSGSIRILSSGAASASTYKSGS
jgi:hypothetical protein